MLHTSKLRSPYGNGFLLTLGRVAAALALAVLLPVAASAYTVVLRTGRHVEIPASFTITRAGITYEYAPGIYVTIQMASIDIAATERSNNEPAGTLLRRAEGQTGAVEKSAPSSPAKAASQVARRTLTDKDLEASRARRETSEALYERRRAELGLPSAEETQRRRAEETRRLSEMQAQAEANDAQAESYWRERAGELRAALAETDAEINYLRAKLAEMPGYLPTISFTSISTVSSVPFVSAPFGRIPRGRFPSAPPGATGMGRALPAPPSPYAGRVQFAGSLPVSQNRFRNGGVPFGFRRRGFPATGGAVLPLPLYAPYSYDYTYDRSALLSRLHELEAQRAGLEARWQLLEDEARRAGAPPGWLRP